MEDGTASNFTKTLAYSTIRRRQSIWAKTGRVVERSKMRWIELAIGNGGIFEGKSPGAKTSRTTYRIIHNSVQFIFSARLFSTFVSMRTLSIARTHIIHHSQQWQDELTCCSRMKKLIDGCSRTHRFSRSSTIHFKNTTGRKNIGNFVYMTSTGIPDNSLNDFL